MSTAAVMQRALSGRPTVLLADDHTLVLEGLHHLLQEHVELVGAVPDGEALLQAAQQLCPDVIVTDLAMPRLNGFEAIRRLRQEGCAASVVVLTMHLEVELALQAFRAGVSGYVLKQVASKELINAIHEVVQGRVYLTPLIAKDFITILVGAVPPARQTPGAIKPVFLSPRQKQILELVIQGLTMKEVGSRLNISSRTAEAHKYEIMESLGTKTTAQLIQYALRYNLT